MAVVVFIHCRIDVIHAARDTQRGDVATQECRGSVSHRAIQKDDIGTFHTLQAIGPLVEIDHATIGLIVVPGSTKECILSDAGQAAGDIYRRKFFKSAESISTYMSHAFFDGQFLNVICAKFRINATVPIIIHIAIAPNRHRLIAKDGVEDLIATLFHFDYVITDVQEVFPDNCRLIGFLAAFGHTEDAGLLVNARESVSLDRQRFLALSHKQMQRTTRNPLAANVVDRCGDIDNFQTGTTQERAVTNGPHRAGEGHTLQVAAILKGFVLYFGQTINKIYLIQRIATLEGAESDVGQAWGFDIQK